MSYPMPLLAAAVGVAVTVWLMIKFNCIHPPGGALVLLMVLNGPGDLAQTSQTVSLVALNVFLTLLFTWLINTWLLGRPYPYRVSAEESADAQHPGSGADAAQRT